MKRVCALTINNKVVHKKKNETRIYSKCSYFVYSIRLHRLECWMEFCVLFFLPSCVGISVCCLSAHSHKYTVPMQTCRLQHIKWFENKYKFFCSWFSLVKWIVQKEKVVIWLERIIRLAKNSKKLMLFSVSSKKRWFWESKSTQCWNP